MRSKDFLTQLKGTAGAPDGIYTLAKATITKNQEECAVFTHGIINLDPPDKTVLEIKDHGHPKPKLINPQPNKPVMTKKLIRQENHWSLIALIRQMIFWGDA